LQIFAFVGPSGTGKSASALAFAHSKNISTIIDDGLLIYKGKKVAGISAKYEKNYITAIKRAVFYQENHMEDVRETLANLRIDSVLILGTSVRMVDQIANKLGLENIRKYFNVEDVRTSSEIKMALYVRKTAGKHIIPVSYVQLEHSIFERLMKRHKKIFSQQNEMIGETTIIRPQFHHGTIHITSQVLKNIIINSCSTIEEIKECNQVSFSLEDLPSASVSLTVRYQLNDMQKNIRLFDIAEKVQRRIFEDFLHFINIELYSINIYINKVTL
jgi:uncharacterized alkaline shock family protein YloU